MRITYKCKGCNKKLDMQPNFDKVNENIRLVMIQALLSLAESDYCYDCCYVEGEEEIYE